MHAFSDFSIATWNVNSIGVRLPLVLRWLETRQPAVLCLQEIKCIEAKFPSADFMASGYRSLVFGQPTYNGVATLVRQDLDVGSVQLGFPDDVADAPRRLLDATINGVRILNVYVPNGQTVDSDKYVYKLAWLARLQAYFEQTCDPVQPLALCGDFNVAHDPLDVYDAVAWEGKVLFSVAERAAFQKLKDWGLRDSFRHLYPDTALYSWWDYRQAAFRRNLGLRIDHIWTTDSLLQSCHQVEIDAETRSWERPSDHAPVLATF